MGTGLVDIFRYARVLRDIGFDGPMELEAEYPNGGAESGADKLTLPREMVLGNLKRDVLTIRAALQQSGTRADLLDQSGSCEVQSARRYGILEVRVNGSTERKLSRHGRLPRGDAALALASALPASSAPPRCCAARSDLSGCPSSGVWPAASENQT